MVSKVYKEFMITGFISFSLLMLLQFGASLPFKAILMFEIGHIWVFLIAIMFVTHVVFFMLLVRKTKRHWDATSHMDVDDLLAQYALLLRPPTTTAAVCCVCRSHAVPLLIPSSPTQV